MADLQKKNGFTPLGNELLEHIFLFPFKRLDLAVIFMTIRFTHGYQRKSSGISLNKYVNNIKADRALISKSLQKLIKASVIKVILPEAGPRPRVLEFNDDYSQWDLSDFISGSSGLSPVQQPVLQGDQHSGLHPEQPLVLSPEQPHLKKEEKKFKESNSSSSSSNIIYIISQEEIKNNTTTTAMIEFEERLKALYDTAFNYQPNLFEIEALKEEIFHDDRFPLSEILLIVQESFRKTATYSPAKRKTNYVIKVIQSKKQEIFLKREQEKKMQEKLSAYSHFLSVYSSFDQLYLQVIKAGYLMQFP